MATGTELLKAILAAAGGDEGALPDNLESTLLKQIAVSLAGSQSGAGIQSIEQTTTSTADGGANVITITLTDGTAKTFTVRNGSKGSTGATGATGPAGAAGATGATGPQGPAGTNGTNGIDGAAGKSAFQYAVEGGYTGTEAEFGTALAQLLAGTAV